MNSRILLTLSILFVCISNCKSDDDDINCTLQYVYGLNISIKNANTNNVITEDITITATDGDYQETLMRIESSNSFFGAGERAGNYIITITSPNYQTFTSNTIKVTSDECHVIPKQIEFSIQPN